jgi:hypothetical protein
MTTRRGMGVVAAVAVAAWLGVTARRGAREDGVVWHAWLRPDTGELSVHGHGEPGTFWPRYRRALLGQPWPGDYPCRCRTHPDPGLVELASASESGPVIALTERLSGPHQRAVGHRLSAESLRRSIAWDEQRVARLDDNVARAARSGRVIHGADGVRRGLQEGVAHNAALLRYHEGLQRKYEAAARHPWDPVEPDPPEPE